ncbi:MAG: hypothetical protein ACK55I_49500, partial [bacterium]
PALFPPLSQASLTNIQLGKRKTLNSLTGSVGKRKTLKTLTGSGVEGRELRIGLEASGELGTSHRGTSPHATPWLVQLLPGTTVSTPEQVRTHALAHAHWHRTGERARGRN